MRVASLILFFSLVPAVAVAQCAATVLADDPIAANGARGVVIITDPANCYQTPQADAPWIRVAEPTVLADVAVVRFSIAANPASVARAGVLSFGGGSTRITQDPSRDCTYQFDRADSVSVPADGSSGTLRASSNCSWSVSAHPWIEVVSPTGSPTAVDDPFFLPPQPSGFSIDYAVQPNASTAARIGSISIGAESVLMEQAGHNCLSQVNPGSTTISEEGGAGTFSVSADPSCSWNAVSPDPWIQAKSTGSGNGLVAYTVAPNSTITRRTGFIAVGGRAFIVAQEPGACSVSLSNTAMRAGSPGGSFSVAIVARAPVCVWEAAAHNSWIHIASAPQGVGSSELSFSVDPNTDPNPRVGVIAVSGQTLTIAQASPGPTLSAILHGATLKPGNVAPGELVMLYGTDVGPDTPVAAQWTPGTPVPTLVGGVRVLFQGIEAGVARVASDQVWAVAPFGVAGAAAADIVVEHDGKRSAAVTVGVVGAVPGVFTAIGSGSGQAIATNADGSPNGTGSPAPKGSAVRVYATGVGESTITDSTGLTTLRLPLSARIGGKDATVLRIETPAGVSPGIIQLQIQIPLDVAAGDNEVILRTGDYESPAGVTIAVR